MLHHFESIFDIKITSKRRENGSGVLSPASVFLFGISFGGRANGESYTIPVTTSISH